MAISISGDTGISAVQDGTIVTADLANDAVTQAKIASGAVGSTELSSGAVGATQLASTLDLSGKTITLPTGVGGKILQVVQTVKTNEFTGAGTAWRDVTGMTATITPASSSNKIIVMYSIGISAADPTGLRLYRGATHIAFGDAGPSGSQQGNVGNESYSGDGNRGFQYNMTYLDSPATTSATTYKLQTFTHSSPHYVNRTVNNTSSNYNIRGISTITLVEVAG